MAVIFLFHAFVIITKHYFSGSEWCNHSNYINIYVYIGYIITMISKIIYTYHVRTHDNLNLTRFKLSGRHSRGKTFLFFFFSSVIPRFFLYIKMLHFLSIFCEENRTRGLILDFFSNKNREPDSSYDSACGQKSVMISREFGGWKWSICTSSRALVLPHPSFFWLSLSPSPAVDGASQRRKRADQLKRGRVNFCSPLWVV